MRQQAKHAITFFAAGTGTKPPSQSEVMIGLHLGEHELGRPEADLYAKETYDAL